jgi:dipeptidyl aminopeptidase/acylaminoacyl peptidase
MPRDLRSTSLYREIEEHLRRWLEPGFGRITGAADPAPSPDGTRVAFTGSRLDALEGTPDTRICLVDVEGGDPREVTSGPNSDRLPRWSPDGRSLAFLSDRAERGRFGLYLLEDGRLGEALAGPEVDGTVEYLAWSPDGGQILLGVAGLGADKAGAEGSGTTEARKEDLPDWVPTVDEGIGEEDWRRVWVYDVRSRTVSPVSREGLNVWEAAWCGTDRLAAVVSDRPTEEAWYEAPLALIDLDSGKETVVLRPSSPLHQLAMPRPSPDGSTIAVAEAVCSDRGIVAGVLLLVDPDGSEEPERVPTLEVDVSHLAWRDGGRLLFAGEHHLDSVVGELDRSTREVRELWRSDGSCGYWHPSAEPAGEDGFVVTSDAYDRPPSVVLVQVRDERTLASFAHGGTEHLVSSAGSIETLTWTAPDGLEIEGYLIRPPRGAAPFPTLLWVHGGPIGRTTNMWAPGRGLIPILTSRGYAVLLPNPRGSSGRGQDFGRMVIGDMGGADARDLLAGVDALVERGLADPERIGVIGGSYGGFMSAWLVTQDDRFAAAVPIAPVTDYYSQHWTSNIGFWDRLFIGEDPWVPGGEYFRRSPVMFARNVRTPVLQVAGGRDRCTPPGQAEEFHRALLEVGAVETELVIYPKEGHGVRSFPAAIDFAARVVGWFERHMPAGGGGDRTGGDRPSEDGDGPD